MDAIKLTEEDKCMFREMIIVLFPDKKGKEGNVSVHDIVPYGLIVSIAYDDGTRRIHWYEFMIRHLIPAINKHRTNVYRIITTEFVAVLEKPIIFIYPIFKTLKL